MVSFGSKPASSGGVSAALTPLASRIKAAKRRKRIVMEVAISAEREQDGAKLDNGDRTGNPWSLAPSWRLRIPQYCGPALVRKRRAGGRRRDDRLHRGSGACGQKLRPALLQAVAVDIDERHIGLAIWRREYLSHLQSRCFEQRLDPVRCERVVPHLILSSKHRKLAESQRLFRTSRQGHGNRSGFARIELPGEHEPGAFFVLAEQLPVQRSKRGAISNLCLHNLANEGMYRSFQGPRRFCHRPRINTEAVKFR